MSIKSVIVAAALVTAATAAISVQPTSAQLDNYTFEQYEKDFRKVYASQNERSYRRSIFETELRAILAHNVNPKYSYKKGVNQLTDRTGEEFNRLNGDIVHDSVETKHLFKASGQKHDAPETLDYRKAFPTVLSGVKDQGHCGSCWAHSAIEAIESGYAHKTGKLFVLSQQQMVNCAKNPGKCGGSGGCGGATAGIGIQYASQGEGVGQEWVNGYTSYFGDVAECNFNATKNSVLVKANGLVINDRNNQNAIIESLVKNGPLGVSVDASLWKSYESGVFNGCGDYSKNITMNHAVQLVGYGTEAGRDYWIIRNSWSAKWGENGFMRLAKEKEPKCGWTNNWNTAGSGCPGVDPDNVWVCGECGILYNAVHAKFD